MTVPALTQKDAVQNTTDGTSFLGTASIQPTANSLIVVTLEWSKASLPDDPTSVVGYGLTFFKQVVKGFNTGGTPLKKVALYWAIGPAPSTSQLTITFPASQTACNLVVDEISGVDVVNPVAQSASNSGDSVAVAGTVVATLAALRADGQNAVYIGAGSSTNNAALDPEAGFTQSRDQGVGTPANGIYAGYSGTAGDMRTADNTASVTVATATKDVGVVAMEANSARSTPPRITQHIFQRAPHLRM